MRETLTDLAAACTGVLCASVDGDMWSQKVGVRLSHSLAPSLPLPRTLSPSHSLTLSPSLPHPITPSLSYPHSHPRALSIPSAHSLRRWSSLRSLLPTMTDVAWSQSESGPLTLSSPHPLSPSLPFSLTLCFSLNLSLPHSHSLTLAIIFSPSLTRSLSQAVVITPLAPANDDRRRGRSVRARMGSRAHSQLRPGELRGKPLSPDP